MPARPPAAPEVGSFLQSDELTVAPDPAAAQIPEGDPPAQKRCRERSKRRCRRRAPRSKRVAAAWWKLTRHFDAPRFLRRPYVFGGYRRQLTAWECLRSCFMIHNESVNIWSHLLGAFLFVLLAIRVCVSPLSAVFQSHPGNVSEVSSEVSPMHWSLVGPWNDAVAAAGSSAAAASSHPRVHDLRLWAFDLGTQVTARRPWMMKPSSYLPGSLEGVSSSTSGLVDSFSVLVSEASSRFNQASAAVIGDRAPVIPPSCAGSEASWTECMPIVERVEHQISHAGEELQRLMTKLQESVICGRRQCFNVTVAGGNDARIFALLEQTQAAAMARFRETVSKKTLQVGFAAAAAQLSHGLSERVDQARTAAAEAREHLTVKAERARHEMVSAAAEAREQLTVKAERARHEMVSAAAEAREHLTVKAERARHEMVSAAAEAREQLTVKAEMACDGVMGAAEAARQRAERLALSISRMVESASSTRRALLMSGSRAFSAGALTPTWMVDSSAGGRMSQANWWEEFAEGVRSLPERLQAEVGVVSPETAAAGPHAGGAVRYVWPLVLYLISAGMCLSFSALYHCFGTAMSYPMYNRFIRLDFTGIVALIYGSIFPVIYYTHFCHPRTQQLYLVAASALGIPKVLACMTDTYMQGHYTYIRVGAFIAFGLLGLVPLAHALLRFSMMTDVAADGALAFDAVAEQNVRTWSLAGHVGTMGCAYLLGTVIYVTHFPEVIRPGRFDNCCSSHQLWHLSILAAAYILWLGLRDYVHWRLMTPCPANS
jgi:predicted membrane channel-forming protein YqfA (hemolysin III family)